MASRTRRASSRARTPRAPSTRGAPRVRTGGEVLEFERQRLAALVEERHLGRADLAVARAAVGHELDSVDPLDGDVLAQQVQPRKFSRWVMSICRILFWPTRLAVKAAVNPWRTSSRALAMSTESLRTVRPTPDRPRRRFRPGESKIEVVDHQVDHDVGADARDVRPEAGQLDVQSARRTRRSSSMTAGLNRSTWPTMTMRPLPRAASASQPSVVLARGRPPPASPSARRARGASPRTRATVRLAGVRRSPPRRRLPPGRQVARDAGRGPRPRGEEPPVRSASGSTTR